MEFSVFPLNCRSRWLKAALLCLPMLLPVRSALAIDSTFDNAYGWSDVLTPIQATNFVNDSTFTFNNSSSGSWLVNLYHNWQYTQNFTNTANGEMDGNTGFYFDTYTPQNGDVAAASFYNAGLINCGTGNSTFLSLYQYGGQIYGGYGGIDVWATNIYHSSVITVGVDGLARFTGDTIDFENGNVMFLNASAGLGYFTNNTIKNIFPNIYATGQADINTNGWDPGSALGPTYAYSAPMNTAPYGLYLNNSVPYFDIHKSNPTNYIIRMIFLQDASVNVATNVYWSSVLGDGWGNIEWIGTYVDPATSNTITKYLYLEDDFKAAGSSNILAYADPGIGVPGNYSFYQSDTQLSLGTPAPSSFSYLPNQTVSSNIYSYVNAQFISTDVATNYTLHGAPFYLPGRVEFAAAQSLNLAQSSISGINYLLLNSTNEFDSDGQSAFAAPYSDIFLGHTNGTMTITNLLAPSPAWTGTVQAWSTRWFFTDTNSGINYDFRVELVNSQLGLGIVPQVGTFQLNCTNNVVLSDVLNINSNLVLNCTNLLLTTNGLAQGAYSLDGELNLNSPAINWAAATPQLRCLTNYGAIRTASLAVAQFGNLALPYLTLFNDGLITNRNGTTITTADFENYGTMLAGSGSFTVQSLTTTLSNGVVQAAGSFSDAAASLVISGTAIQAGKSLTLVATNLLTDYGMTGNYWSLGAGYAPFTTGTGLVLPVLPASGDLLGTIITNTAVSGIKITDTWAGQDRGYSAAGFHDNAALGQLVLDATANSSKFNFTGTSTDGTTNAIYVDCLVLNDYAGYSYQSSANLPALTFNTNLVIYYAQALDLVYGSVAEKINHFNDDHLRWASTYAGKFSSTNLVYPDGTTNAVNAALAASKTLDSDRDGIYNYYDPTPVLVPSQLRFNVTVTNAGGPSARVGWQTIPLAGNSIYYSTNLASPTNWVPFTNFTTYYWLSNNLIVPGTKSGANSFTSPQDYIGLGNVYYPPGPDNSQVTNVWVQDPVTNGIRFYRIMVQPN